MLEQIGNNIPTKYGTPRENCGSLIQEDDMNEGSSGDTLNDEEMCA